MLLQEYYTSGFLSLQAAIDAYVLGLGLPAALDTSLVPLSGHGGARANATGGEGAQGSAPANLTAWTEWGAVMPTSAYTHNDFYVRARCSRSLACQPVRRVQRMV